MSYVCLSVSYCVQIIFICLFYSLFDLFVSSFCFFSFSLFHMFFSTSLLKPRHNVDDGVSISLKMVVSDNSHLNYSIFYFQLTRLFQFRQWKVKNKKEKKNWTFVTTNWKTINAFFLLKKRYNSSLLKTQNHQDNVCLGIQPNTVQSTAEQN